MPTVFHRDGLRYFFFSNEGDPREPPHIHVRGGGRDAKIRLEPLKLVESNGFTSGELTRIMSEVEHSRLRFLNAWHDHFSDDGSFR